MTQTSSQAPSGQKQYLLFSDGEMGSGKPNNFPDAAKSVTSQVGSFPVIYCGWAFQKELKQVHTASDHAGEHLPWKYPPSICFYIKCQYPL